MEEIDNAELLTAIEDVARNDNPMTRELLYEVMLRSDLIVPLVDECDIQEGDDLVESNRLVFKTLRDESGRIHMLVFTHVATLGVWQPRGGRYAIVYGQTLFETAASADVDSVLLNPGFHTGGSVERREIQSLAQRVIPTASGFVGITIEKSKPDDTQFYFLMPEGGRPPGLAKQIAGVLSGYPDVAAAYLLEQRKDGCDSLLMLWLVMDLPSDNDLVERIVNHTMRAITTLMAGKQLYISVMSAQMLMECHKFDPIYTRPGWKHPIIDAAN